jgi:tetratricopeptide (TPR) repeat protein
LRAPQTKTQAIASLVIRSVRANRLTRQPAVLTICILVLSLASPAQREGHEVAETVPQEILTRPVQLRHGIGTVHEKVTTLSPEAQAFYDQGLAYLNSFVWIEAARSFNQALRLDAGLAMAHLGLSDAYIGLQDVPSARGEFEKARALSQNVSENERARIAIRDKQIEYLEDSGNLQKYFAYREAIAEALRVAPNDPWLWILRGFADEGSPLAHGQGGNADTIAFYQTALVFSPDNFAAHHYLAHTFENLALTRQALEQSEIYVRSAPSIPHAHHMVGHDLRRLGRTEEAIREFLEAEQLENTYYQTEDIPARYDWHHAHNLNLLAMCYQTLGQLKAAEAAYREAFALPAYVDLAEYNRKSWPEFLLGQRRPQEALRASLELEKSRWPLGRFVGHALAGRALLAMGHLEDAENELSLTEQESEHIPAAVIAMLPSAGILRAEILLKEDQFEQGNALMGQIEDKIQAAPGPDAWSDALFELESVALLARQTGDWDLAESTARRMIHHDPSYAGGHYALALASRHRGDLAAARREFAAAEKLWDKADAEVQRSGAQDNYP